MTDEKKLARASITIIEKLLEVDQLENALAGALEIIVRTLDCEAGVIWYRVPKTDRLIPLYHIGPSDISSISIENGIGIEGIVTNSGDSILIEDTSADPRFEGTVFDENGFSAKSMICVPLNNLQSIIGCVEVINKKDGSVFDTWEMQFCSRMAALAAIVIEDNGYTF